jgi:hypothetical protein
MRRALGAIVLLLCGIAVAADAEPYTVVSGPMMARAAATFPYYRTDCSGFVSMVWGLPVSYATPRKGLKHDLMDVAKFIGREELRAGDALLAMGRHVRLFEYWTDAARTTYVAYDFGATPVKHQAYVWGAPGEYDYIPIRYDPR